MSANCWSILKLARDSDERSIKRQYAALLKVTRPDEDPEGFQRLREAYEQALHYARNRAEALAEADSEERVLEVELQAQASHVADARPVVAQEPSSAPAPAADDWHEKLLDELFAQINLDSVDECLTIAQQRGCQAGFERRLLDLCLGAHPEAQPIANWALERFDWLRPWQPTPLPRALMQCLAERLLAWQFTLFDQLLGSGQEPAALAWVDDLLASPWLESLDRREWVQRSLMAWLVESPEWSPDFFRAVCARLDLQTDDYQTQHDPLWNALLQRFEEQQLANRLRLHLEQKKPVLLADQAAWLLLKDLNAGQRRRLVDQMTAEAWNACAQLEDLLLHRFPQLLGRLGRTGLPDWRSWCPKPESSAWRLWLLVVCFFTAQLPEVWSMLDTDPAFAFDPRVLASSLAAAGFCLMVVIGGTYVWYGLTSFLGYADARLSNLLLPPSVTRQGTGLLLVRHVVPSLALGAGCAWWISPILGLGLGWAYGAVIALLVLTYSLSRLNLLRQLGLWRSTLFSRAWLKDQHVKFLSVVAAMAVVAVVGAYSERGRPDCVLGAPGYAVCLKTVAVTAPLPKPAAAAAPPSVSKPGASKPVVCKPGASGQAACVKTPPPAQASKATDAPAKAKAPPAAAKTPPAKPRQVPVSPPAKPEQRSAYQLGETLTPEGNLLPRETLTPISGPAKKIELKYK